MNGDACSRPDNLRTHHIELTWLAILNSYLCRTELAADGTRPRPCGEIKKHFVAFSYVSVTQMDTNLIQARGNNQNLPDNLAWKNFSKKPRLTDSKVT
jgi:hypothetical protein